MQDKTGDGVGAAQTEDFMVLKEFARACGVTTRTVHRWIHDAVVSPARWNGRYRFRRSEVRMTTERFAQRMLVTARTVRRWIRDGRVHPQRSGRRWWFTEAEIAEARGLSPQGAEAGE